MLKTETRKARVPTNNFLQTLGELKTIEITQSDATTKQKATRKSHHNTQTEEKTERLWLLSVDNILASIHQEASTQHLKPSKKGTSDKINGLNNRLTGRFKFFYWTIPMYLCSLGNWTWRSKVMNKTGGGEWKVSSPSGDLFAFNQNGIQFKQWIKGNCEAHTSQRHFS